MRKRKTIIGVVLFILFAVSLYLVDFSKYGSYEVGKYNEGYGTIDMKSYDSDIVKCILSGMTQEGIDVYKAYYWMDGIFIVFFGLFQCFLTMVTYSFAQKNSEKILVCLFPIVRGICDIIENALLYITLGTFPDIDTSMIGIASVFTTVKLWTIRLWVLELFVGIVLRIIMKRKRKMKN